MIVIRSDEEIRKMREAGRIVAGVLDLMKESIRVGVNTRLLDDIADEYIRNRGGIPSFLGYQGFPKSICTSINEVVVHGIPNATSLTEGDIIGIDVGVIFQGYHADAARTYAVGKAIDSGSPAADGSNQAFSGKGHLRVPAGKLPG